jgi:hypothetical protein
LSADIACRHCGATTGFFVNVEVSGDAWCEAEISMDEDRNLVLSHDDCPQDANLRVSWIEEVGCPECDKRVPRSRIGDLIGPRYIPQVGDRVTLPDGLDGVVSAVLPQRWKNNLERDPKVYVLVDGREFTTLDLTPIEPNPDQLDLLEAA